MNTHRTGQKIEIACPAGALTIEAPGARSVKLERLETTRGWVFGWASTPATVNGLAIWMERVQRVDALHGLSRLRRVMTLVSEHQYLTAMQEAALLPEPYLPLWELLNAEVRRRG